MINVDIELSKKTIIKSLRASGHALYNNKGNDIVCAAATCLLRTAANLLANDKSLKVTGNAEKPGNLEMILIKYPEKKASWLTGVTEFIIKGLSDLENEFPDKINVNISKDLVKQ